MFFTFIPSIESYTQKTIPFTWNVYLMTCNLFLIGWHQCSHIGLMCFPASFASEPIDSRERQKWTRENYKKHSSSSDCAKAGAYRDGTQYQGSLLRNSNWKVFKKNFPPPQFWSQLPRCVHKENLNFFAIWLSIDFRFLHVLNSFQFIVQRCGKFKLILCFSLLRTLCKLTRSEERRFFIWVSFTPFMWTLESLHD